MSQKKILGAAIVDEFLEFTINKNSTDWFQISSFSQKIKKQNKTSYKQIKTSWLLAEKVFYAKEEPSFIFIFFAECKSQSRF